MPDPTFPAALSRLLRSDAARPLVTFYDDATGERVELSVTTYANWVSKTANLVQDELDVEPGGLVVIDLPTHWLGAVWLGAAWMTGLEVSTDPSLAGAADLVVCGPATVEAYAAEVDRIAVVALSLRPLGARFTEPLPRGVTDYGAVVLGQPDLFVPYDPPGPDAPAFRSDEDVLTQKDLLDLAAQQPLVAEQGRLLTDLNPCTKPGLMTLVSPLVRGAGSVWVAHPDESAWSKRYQQERVTDELRA